jgi:hypothetical protein
MDSEEETKSVDDVGFRNEEEESGDDLVETRSQPQSSTNKQESGQESAASYSSGTIDPISSDSKFPDPSKSPDITSNFANINDQSPQKRQILINSVTYTIDGDDPNTPIFSWQKQPREKGTAKPKPRRTAIPRVAQQENLVAKRRIPDYSTFVTQLPSGRIHDLSAATHKPPPPQKKPSTPKSKPPERSRLNMAIIEFTGNIPRVATPKKPDLSKYDDDKFDYRYYSQRIPPRLIDLITHPPSSIIFRTLCGIRPINLTKLAFSQLLLELKKYMNLCISKGLIYESSYLKNIMESVKRSIEVDRRETETKSVNERLLEAKERLQCRINDWEAQKRLLEEERELAIEGLDLKYENEGYKLDCDWDSDQMRAKYNKPSAALIEMRHHARLLLSAHRFEEAALLNLDIERKEREETDEATRQMELGYHLANERLQHELQIERKSLIENYDMKLRGLRRAEETNLRGLRQRIEKFEKMREGRQSSVRRDRDRGGSRFEVKRERVLSGGRELKPVCIGARLDLPPISVKF